MPAAATPWPAFLPEEGLLQISGAERREAGRLHFSEALWAELRPRGVTVTTLCPGTTRTEFFDRSGVPGWAERNRGQDVQTVVRTGLVAFDAGRQYVISGWMNYLVSLAVRLATRATVVEWSLSIFRPRHGREGH